MSITSRLLSLSSKVIPNKPLEEIERQIAGVRDSVTGRMDEFRGDLRQGRAELIASVLEHSAGIAGERWVVFHAAGGDVLGDIGKKVELLKQLDLVDASDERLSPIRRRIAAHELGNVRAVVGDAATFAAAEPYDAVLLPYALSSAEDWFAAADNAAALLRPGGLLGVADFFAARGGDDPAGGRLAALLPKLMGDEAYVSADFVPYLRRGGELVSLDKQVADIPYVPIGIPYFRYVGRKG